jgi:hypothetical protein
MMAPAAAMVKNLCKENWRKHVLKPKMATEAPFVYDAPFFYGVHMERTMADTSSETPDATSTDTQDEIYLPPCREAEKFMTQCPRCNRTMKLKTLMYSHCCKRSFYPTRRAIEQQVLANKAVDIRMASMEQRATQHAQHQTARTTEQRATQHAQHQTARTTTQTRDYSKLLSF